MLLIELNAPSIPLLCQHPDDNPVMVTLVLWADIYLRAKHIVTHAPVIHFTAAEINQGKI